MLREVGFTNLQRFQTEYVLEFLQEGFSFLDAFPIPLL